MRNCDNLRKSGQMTHAHHREKTRGRVAVNVKQSRGGWAAKAATPVAEYLHAFDGLLGCEELQDELQARECGGGSGGRSARVLQLFLVGMFKTFRLRARARAEIPCLYFRANDPPSSYIPEFHVYCTVPDGKRT